jgi:hypothetical protein
MACFKSLVRGAGDDYNIALFIDGLDEFHGDKKNFISLVEEVSRWDGTKICVSIRPENIFHEHSCNTPKLKMQDLTGNDITIYVHGQLQ